MSALGRENEIEGEIEIYKVKQEAPTVTNKNNGLCELTCGINSAFCFHTIQVGKEYKRTEQVEEI